MLSLHSVTSPVVDVTRQGMVVGTRKRARRSSKERHHTFLPARQSVSGSFHESFSLGHSRYIIHILAHPRRQISVMLATLYIIYNLPNTNIRNTKVQRYYGCTMSLRD